MLDTVVRSKNTKMTQARPICFSLPGRAGAGFRKQGTLERLLWRAEGVGCSLEKGKLQVTVCARARGAAQNRQTREGLTDWRKTQSEGVGCGQLGRNAASLSDRKSADMEAQWTGALCAHTALLAPLHLTVLLSEVGQNPASLRQPRAAPSARDTVAAFPNR